MDNMLPDKSYEEETLLPPPLKLDPDKYIGDLDGYEMSEAQKHELLHVLWNIMETMVNLGVGVDTVQIVLPQLFGKAGQDSVNMVAMNNQENFSAAASAGKGKADE